MQAVQLCSTAIREQISLSTHTESVMHIQSQWLAYCVRNLGYCCSFYCKLTFILLLQAVATISDSIITLPVPFLRLYSLEGPAISLAIFKVRIHQNTDYCLFYQTHLLNQPCICTCLYAQYIARAHCCSLHAECKITMFYSTQLS
jgi:hypothetical protein